jgi:exodeoxyribonuclease V gamma subunit
MAARAATQPLEAFQPAVEVMSTGPLPFPILSMLKALGRRVDVNLRVLLPANAFIADIQPRWMQLVQGQAVDLEAEGNPLVAQMGRQAVEAFQGLLELSDGGQEFDAVAEDEDSRSSLLARIQSDVRSLRQPDARDRPVSETLLQGPRPLRSLRVHRCYGARREMEVLRDELLRAFAEIPDLRPEDVLVLAPDLDLYGPLAEAGFTQGPEPRLPLGLAERKQEQRDPLLKALMALLSLASGRGGLSEGLALLDLPALRAGLGEDAASALAARLKASGITFGWDAEHRRALQAGGDATGTWRAGLDRLLAGLWLGQETLAVDGNREPALAVAGELGGGRQALQASLQWCEDLLETLRLWQHPAPPLEWAERLDEALETLLRASRSRLDATLCLEVAQALRQAGLEHACATPMGVAGILDYVQSLGEDEQRRVSAVGGRIALGGLKPLRALPCRVLALVGLSDAAFPRRSQNRAWDLLAALPLPGDRDARKDDRQLFLDSLLAAQDRVIITAPVRGQHSDKLEPLSACVEELLRCALDTLGCGPERRKEWLQALVVDEPLQPFSPRQFSAAAGRERSYDRHALALARRLAQGRVEEPFAVSDCAAAAPAEAPDLDSLLDFLKDPSRAFLKARGMALPREAEDLSDSDDEPVDAALGLTGWQLDQAALDDALNVGNPHLLRRLAADRLLPLGRLGELRGRAVLERARALAAEVRAQAQGRPEAMAANADLGQGRGVQGLLQRGAAGGPLLLWTTRRAELKKGIWDVGSKNLLDAWLKACLASASGDDRAARFVVCPKGQDAPLALSIAMPNPGQARQALLDLLQWREQGQGSLLPFAPDTSLALALALAEGPPKDPRQAALAAWEGDDFYSAGEGRKPAAALAWRGQSPLSEEDYPRWEALARTCWEPLLGWWAQARILADAGEAAEPAKPKPRAKKKKGAA